MLATATAFLTKPGKANITSVDGGDQFLQINWDGMSGINEFTIEWKCGTEDWDDTRRITIKNVTRHVVTPLASGVQCHFRLAAKNATGHGEWSTITTGTPSGETLTASNIETTTLTLTISNYVDAYFQYRHIVPANGTCHASPVGVKSVQLGSLTPGTNYKFQGYGPTGSCKNVIATSATIVTKPGKASGLTVSALDASLAVSWTAQQGAASYKVQWKSGTQDWDATNRQTTSTTTSKTVTTLTNATQYTIRVAAVNASGDGAWSDTATGTPNGEALTVSSISTTGATLTISNWSGDWYYKYTTPSSGTCSSAISTASTTVGSLTANTSYTFKAYSNSGCSTEVATAPAFPTLPAKPTGVSAAAGAGSGKLVLTASVTGNATLTKWQYKQKEGNNSFDANWTDISQTTTTLNHVVSGLDNTKSYQYKVRAVNATGNSAESDASTAVSPAAVTLAASSVTNDSATLTVSNWTSDWYHKRSSPTSPTPSCSSKITAGTYTADLSSLSGNTDYTWKVYSDSGCSTELASDDFLTKPGKPTKPAAAKAGSNKLKVTSSVTGGGTLTKWQYKRKVGTGDFDDDWTDISKTATSLSHTFGSLTNGTNYQYKVRAVNATGNSAESDASTAVSPAAVTLTAGNITDDTARLTIGNWAGRLVSQAQYALLADAELLLENYRRDLHVQPFEPVRQHGLHLEGLQRQRLLDGAGERRLPDQAGQADETRGG